MESFYNITSNDPLAKYIQLLSGRRFSTTCTISAYHH